LYLVPVSDLTFVAALLEIYLLGGRGRIPTVQEHGNAYRFPTGQAPKPGEVGFSYLGPIYAQQLPPSTKPGTVSLGFRSQALARSTRLIQNYFTETQDVGSSPSEAPMEARNLGQNVAIFGRYIFGKYIY
jgi:hypothetical protein